MFSETARRARAAAVSVCAASAIATALLAPLAARPSVRPVPPRPHAALAARAISADSPWRASPVFVARDPFLPAADPHATAVPHAGLHTAAVRLPIAVRAIALGESSRALVDVDGVTRLVGVGDRIGSLRIAIIQVDRILFSDGSAATLEGAHP